MDQPGAIPMKVERITLTHVRVPLVEPFRISNGEVNEKDGIIIRVFAEGLIGTGEASPMSGSFYSDDTPESVWKVLTEGLIPAVLAARAVSVKEVNHLLADLRVSPFAGAGLETAFWDLEAQAAGRPLYDLLGGENTPLVSGLAVGIYSDVRGLLGAIDRHLKEGYARVKIKIQPGWDIDPLTEVRRRFGDLPLMVDANCAYTIEDIEHLASLDDFGLMMIEQPLPRHDLEGHARLQERLRTPVCLDESAEDLASVTRAIHLKSCRIVNIKIQRIGGLANALAVHDCCAAAGVPVWAGTMPELGIGGAQTLHLATLPNFRFPTDVESSARWFVDDIVDPLITVREGRITIPAGTGNCFTLSARAMERYRIAERVFRKL